MKKQITALTLLFLSVLFSQRATGQQQYCTPLHTINCSSNVGTSAYRDSDVKRFIFNTLDNAHTGCSANGYSNFSGPSNPTTTVYPGQVIPFFVQGGKVSPTMFAIWVDWDNDTTFGQANELVWVANTPATGIGSQPFFGYITIPAGITPGTKRLRVRGVFNTGPLFSGLECSDLNGETEDYTITVAASANMAVSSVEVSQVTRNVFAGLNKAKILKVNIKTTGIQNPLQATEFSFNTTGTTNTAHIKNIRLYAAGGLSSVDSILRPSMQIGTTVTNPASVSFTGLTQALQSGNNYFWLAYDVDTNTAVNEQFDANVTDIKVNGASTTLPANPAGARNTVSYATYQYYIPNPAVLVRNTAVPGPNTYGIGNIIFNFASQIANNTADLDTVTYYPTQVANVYRNATYPYSGTSGIQTNLQSLTIWVDWDNDGIYDRVSEQITFNSSITTYTGNINIPCTAAVGPHRMRVTTDFIQGYWTLNYNDFCGIQRPLPDQPIFQGDIEEYVINILADQVPVASFTNDSIGYTGGFNKFTNTSLGVGNSYEWDFNNDGVTDNTTQHPTYQFNTPGWKKVTLKINNTSCSGTSSTSFSDSILIIDPLAVPTADFVVNRNITDINLPVLFTDKSFYGPNTWQWNITPQTVNSLPAYQYINGTTATSQNPQVQFLIPGNYSVRLTTANTVGTGPQESRTDYIKVYEPDFMCGATTSSTENYGFLYDDGGASGTYANAGTATTCSFLIEPANCVDEINIRFNEFDVNVYGASLCATFTGDRVFIYDGADNTGIPLHTQAGFPGGFTNAANNIPQMPPNVVAKSGKVYIEFFKNCAFNGNGFGLEWYSIPSVGAASPVADAIVPDTVYFGEIATFSAVNTAPGLKFRWDMDNDGSTESTDSVFTGNFASAGTYTLALIVENCAGIDSFVTTFVVADPGAPKANFSADNRQVLLGGVVHFTDLSSKAILDWTWTSNRPGDIEFVNGTDFLSQHPYIQFNDTGKFSIQLQVTNFNGVTDTISIDLIEVIGGKPCAIAQHFNTDIGTSKVIFAGINYASAVGISSYSNFTGFAKANVTQGRTYDLIMERITTFDRMTRAVWIDWNGDGDFNDTLEAVAYERGSRAKSFTTSITVPEPPLLSFGSLRMRIGAALGYDTVTACGSPTNLQEYEDYLVIVDTRLPQIQLTGSDSVFVAVGTSYTEPGATAIDYLNNNISGLILVSGTVNTLKVGSYLLTYTITDNLGFSSDITRKVYVGDTVAPVIVLTGANPLRIQAGTAFNDPGYSTTDNYYAGAVTEVISTVNTNLLGNYTVTYTATDTSGNTAIMQIRDVEVFDSIKPLLSLIGPDTVILDVMTSYFEFGTTYSDNYDQSIAAPVVSGTVDSSVLNDYTLQYTVTDNSGNSSTRIRVVRVVDRIAPQIIVHNPIIVSRNDPKPALADSVQISDNYYSVAQLKPLLVITESIDMSAAGIYPVTYQVTDLSNNASRTEKGVVIVKDHLSVTELPDNSITVYPNPSAGIFYVAAEGISLSGTQPEVYTVDGRRLSIQAVAQDKGWSIDLGYAAPGTYFLLIKNGSENSVFKLIKN